MMQVGDNDTSTEGKGIVQDASEAFLSQKFNIGQGSILTNPTFPLARVGVQFYLTTDLKELKNRVFGELESTAAKVDSAFQSIVNKMGDGAGLGASIRKNFTEAVSSVQLIGMDFKDVQTAAESTLEVFGRNVSLSAEEYKNLLATQQVTGQNVKQLEEGFLNAGMSIKDITKEMYNVTQVATAIGVNARLVSANVVSNLDKLNRYGFQNGVEGLAKMAAKAAALRIDLGETLSIADDLMDPEGAIELASTLQRLGTTSAALTDPLRLMDMAQNDVGALQEELAKMFSTYAEFNEENQKFEILPSARRELKELERQLGVPLGTIEKMAIGTKELDKKLSEISFSGFDIPRETQELIANMSMMGEEGEYMVKFVDEEGKAREETTADFLEEFGGDVEKLQKALGRQKEEEGKSIEDKMYDRAGETLSSMQRIESYNRAAAEALGLATGGGEFGKQVLESNEALAKSFNTSIIQQMGPNGPIATAFNDQAKKQQENFEILTGKKPGDKGQAAVDIIKGAEEMVGTVAKQAGNAAVGTLKDVGKTLGVDTSTLMTGLTDFMTSVGITDQSLKDWTDTLKQSKNAILNLVPSGVKNIFQSTPSAPTGTVTGPTSIVTPTQITNEPTPLQQVNEITSLPIQNTAENLLAPEIQQATKEGMSQALDEELSYYSASPSLAVTIKKDETEGKGIQIPKKPEEASTEANLVQQTNENVTEVTQTVAQQTTNLENETNFNVLNEVFNTTNEELKDISVTNSSLLKTSTEAFEKSQSLITNTNTLLSSIQQSSALVKSSNTVASTTTTTTTISPTPAAATTNTTATVTKPETPKTEETKAKNIEIKRAGKDEVGLFGMSPKITGPLKIKDEETIKERTEFVTKLTDAEIKNYEEKKKEQLNFTNFLNQENEVKKENSKISVDEQKLSSDLKNQQIIDEKNVNSLVSERTNFVTKLSEQEISNLNKQKEEQLNFTNFLNKENEVKKESGKISVDEQKISSDSKNKQIIDEKSVNSLVSERTEFVTKLSEQEILSGGDITNQLLQRQEFVTKLSEQEITNLNRQKEEQSTFVDFLNQENVTREQSQKNINNQNLVSSDILKQQSVIQTQINDQSSTRNDLVTMMSAKELQTFEDKKTQQGISLNFLNKENEIKKESLKDIQSQKTTYLDSQNQEFIFGQQLNEQIIERDNYVTQFSNEEIRLLDEQKEKQLSFNELFEKEIENRRVSTENNLNSQSTISNIKNDEISVGRKLNEQIIERDNYVTQLTEKEIRLIEEQNNEQLSFNNLLNQENSIREEYVTKLQETEKDKSVTSVVSGGELTNVSDTLSTVNKETVKNKTVTETATELHKKLATLYDGIIDESEKSVVTAINESDALKTPPATADTTKKIENQNLFDTKPSVLGKFVATGEVGEGKTTSMFNPLIPEFNKIDDTSVTNYVNQIPTQSAGANLFDTRPSLLGQYTAGKTPETTTATIVNPKIPKQSTEGNIQSVATQTDFGFGQEIPTSVAEFKGAENTLNQFFTPETIEAPTVKSQKKNIEITKKDEEKIKNRTEFVSNLSEQEISSLEKQNERQLSFYESFNETINLSKENQQSVINQSNFVTDIQKAQLEVANQLNENYNKRTEFVSNLSEQEISSLEKQNERQLSFDELLNQETTFREDYVTALNDIEKDKSVTNVMNTNDITKIDKSVVSKTNESVSETALRLHEKMKTLYDGVIDESEKSVATVINDTKTLKTPITSIDTTKKIENQNLFQNEPSALGQYVATGKLNEAPTQTIAKPFIPEFNKIDDTSVTNFVNQVLPNSEGVNLFDNEPSVLGQYVATGKENKSETPLATTVKPEIPKPLNEDKKIVTTTDFGFSQEVPTSVAEFKGAEDIINQFFTPEAIAAVATPIAQTDVEKVQELQRSTTSTQNINDNRTLDVTIKTPNITDPNVAENYRKDIVNILKGELPNMIDRDKGLQDQIRSYSNPNSANFGLTSSNTTGSR